MSITTNLCFSPSDGDDLSPLYHHQPISTFPKIGDKKRCWDDHQVCQNVGNPQIRKPSNRVLLPATRPSSCALRAPGWKFHTPNGSAVTNHGSPVTNRGITRSYPPQKGKTRWSLDCDLPSPSDTTAFNLLSDGFRIATFGMT